MAISTEISDADILEQVKISRKMPEITEQIIMNRIIREEAEKAGIKVEVKELQEAADDFRARNNLIRAKSTQMWLKMNHLSLDEFENIIRLELLSNKLRNFIVSDKVEKYFYQHQLDFDRAALYEVVLESRELASELYYAFREQEVTFQYIANKYIRDIELKRKGGYLGEIERKDLNREFLSVFSINELPRIIKPITTSVGTHLILVEEIIKAKLDQDTYQRIENYLFTEYLKAKLKDMI
jgi:parvulin-like peptidyl-prolyl isomerase